MCFYPGRLRASSQHCRGTPDILIRGEWYRRQMLNESWGLWAVNEFNVRTIAVPVYAGGGAGSWNAAWWEYWSVMGSSVTTSELYTAVVSYPCVQPGSYSCTGFYSRFLQDRTSFLETNFLAAEGFVIQSQNVVYKHWEFSELSSYFKHWLNTKSSSAGFEYEPCFLRISLGGSGPWWPRFAV